MDYSSEELSPFTKGMSILSEEMDESELIELNSELKKNLQSKSVIEDNE